MVSCLNEMSREISKGCLVIGILDELVVIVGWVFLEVFNDVIDNEDEL